jgi:hypothetical protein
VATSSPRLIALVTCWGRGRLEAASLAHHAPLFDELVVVVSPDDPDPVDLRPPPRDGRLHRVEAPNEPLGAKHNAGLQAALYRSASHVVVIGSDDFLSPRVVASLRRLAAEGAEHVGMLDCYRLDRRTGRCVWEVGPRKDDSRRIYGSGRMVAARWLRACGGWTPDRERHLDSDLDDRLEAAGAPYVRGLRMRDAGSVVFTTGTINMWPKWSSASRPADAGSVQDEVGCVVPLDGEGAKL